MTSLNLGWEKVRFCFSCVRRFLKEKAINFVIGGFNHDLLIFAEMKSCATSLQGTHLSV